MKNKIFLVVLLFLQLSIGNVFAQDITTVEAKNQDISDNLDLEAVASIFGESKDMEDFERRLNDPDVQICNLDLNDDGEVDYLRVLETAEESTHLITIQAVLGKDLYQDVATIDVEKDKSGETKVQVVGDVYMYGNDYIIEPVYVRQPVFFVYFWNTQYDPWYSPYYYNYYPTYYNPWNPYPSYRYRRYVHTYINSENTYSYAKSRRSRNSVALHEKVRRNDYARNNPDKTFSKRNDGITNRADLVTVRKSERSIKAESIESPRKIAPMDRMGNSGRRVKENWTPPSSVVKKSGNVNSREIQTPTRRIETRDNNTNRSQEKNTRVETRTHAVEKRSSNNSSSQREIKAPNRQVETRTREVQQSKPNTQRDAPAKASNPEKTRK